MLGKADDSPGEGRQFRVRVGREDLRLLHREVLRSRGHISRLSNASDADDETAGNFVLLMNLCLEYLYI